MLSEDDLAEMADSILSDGQDYPITLDHTGRVVDGRNRLVACSIAGVEPVFAQRAFESEQAIGDFIYRQNSIRRSDSPSQKIMAFALIYPEPYSGPRKSKGEKSEQNVLILTTRLAHARKIVKAQGSEVQSIAGIAVSLVDEVRRNKMSIEEALKQLNGVEAGEAAYAERLQILHTRAPDLAELVVSGKLAYDDAIKLYDMREVERTTAINAGKKAAKQGLIDFESAVTAILTAIATIEQGPPSIGVTTTGIISEDMMQRALQAMDSLHEAFERTQGKG